ncbi:PqqD family peptide modification chaperone [Roseibaca sp. V10]|uniref:PqqD family peptide modification chaperone n=1 Tax=Roseinatronobacter domitianus TaxID=2940293 RepID=A0ABT0M2W5_9RHOB|nr:PqqD family peptide modification chaperone [Roseibaca domitiana]MCL1629197.1 PqqD family peptide modification chaperone [Roseibaca domitiana]
MTNSPAFQRATNVVSAEMDGETVIMSLEKNVYFGLSGSGGRIWELLETPVSLAALVETLAQEYDVAPETCRADVVGILDDMQANGLVTSVG